RRKLPRSSPRHPEDKRPPVRLPDVVSRSGPGRTIPREHWRPVTAWYSPADTRDNWVARVLSVDSHLTSPVDIHRWTTSFPVYRHVRRGRTGAATHFCAGDPVSELGGVRGGASTPLQIGRGSCRVGVWTSWEKGR